MNILKSYFWMSCFIGAILVSSTPVEAEKLVRSLFKVEQMTCNACAAKIYNRLMVLNGVEGMLVNIEKNLIAVDHQDKLTLDTLLSAMAEIDKPAKPMPLSAIDVPMGITSTKPGWQKQSDGWLSKLFRIVTF